VSRALAAEAAQHWEYLAEQEDRMAEYTDQHAARLGSSLAYRAKAETYRKTAASLRLEASTGEWHCSCCLKTKCHWARK
jgi:hypothetical protein